METSGTVPAYDLRISIQDTEPEIWRRIQVPETITVPELHLAVQAAFGWENRHLYGIRCTDRHGQPRSIIGPDEAAEDTSDEPASGVALFELLDAQKPGPTTLEYEYDFGDCWTHRMEIMGPANLPVAAMRCTDGANRGPVEDSGGPGGYRRFVEIVAEREHKEHQDASGWLWDTTGENWSNFDPHAFTIESVDRRLRLLSLRLWPEPLTDAERDAVLRPLQWLLENATPDGLELTKDGYLKPTMVRQTMEELGWDLHWFGKGNREAHARPVLELREHMLSWKLVRKLKAS